MPKMRKIKRVKDKIPAIIHSAIFMLLLYDVFYFCRVGLVCEYIGKVGEEVIFRVTGGHPVAGSFLHIDMTGRDEGSNSIGSPKFAI